MIRIVSNGLCLGLGIANYQLLGHMTLHSNPPHDSETNSLAPKSSSKFALILDPIFGHLGLHLASILASKTSSKTPSKAISKATSKKHRFSSSFGKPGMLKIYKNLLFFVHFCYFGLSQQASQNPSKIHPTWPPECSKNR